MEKLIYLLGRPENADIEALSQQLRGEIVAKLTALGASAIRLCIDDADVASATNRQGDMAAASWCVVSLWVNSRLINSKLVALFGAVSSFQHGYAVAESEQLRYDFQRDGSRTAGMNQVVFFRGREDLPRAAWLSIWLESHTDIAIDTQSTFGYRQHVVGDVLTSNSPHFGAIVEENFPVAAMNSLAAFYDAEGDDAKLKERLEAMMNSVTRFIDMDSLQVLPTSEYNL
ncbi:MAG: hypothetical protein ACI9GW_003186 [Halieaceae bacterium]|jgi:hypothetical protein